MTESILSAKRVVKDVVSFRGHPMVRSTHPTTIEVTTEDHLTERGDCIIGIGASKGCAGLDARVKTALRGYGAMVTLRILVGDFSFEVKAEGDPRLELSHPYDIVIRKSEFISDRTLAVRANAASKDIPKRMIHLLRSPAVAGRLEIEVS